MSSFLRRRNPNGKRDWRGALEDAFLLFLGVLIAHLLAYGFPPTPEALYISLLTAFYVFVISLQRRFGIELPEKVKPLEKE